MVFYLRWSLNAQNVRLSCKGLQTLQNCVVVFYIKYAFKPGLEWLKYEDVRLQQKVCIVKVYVVLVFAHHVH